MLDKRGDDTLAAFAYTILCAVALKGSKLYNTKSWTPTGMHVTYFIHGALGFLRYQGYSLGINGSTLNTLYTTSLVAAKFFGLASYMTDVRYKEGIRNNSQYEKALAVIHWLSGIVPFVQYLMGRENECLNKASILYNILSLAINSSGKDKKWTRYAVGFAFFAYCIAPLKDAVKCSCSFAVDATWPIGLALLEYCIIRQTLKDQAQDRLELTPPPSVK